MLFAEGGKGGGRREVVLGWGVLCCGFCGWGGEGRVWCGVVCSDEIEARLDRGWEGERWEELDYVR